MIISSCSVCWGSWLGVDVGFCSGVGVGKVVGVWCGVGVRVDVGAGAFELGEVRIGWKITVPKLKSFLAS